MMKSPNWKFLLMLIFFQTVYSYECEMSANICVTSLDITSRLTMMHPTEKAVYPKAGKLYKYNDLNAQTPIPIDTVVTADGWEMSRLVVLANETMPGPPIIVYLGQRVKIHVTNNLLAEEVTIHWHGLPQEGTPYMDGVPFLTQCPINSGQTFVYDFIASQKGTYWYHSHVGAQRSNGLFGAFIVREKKVLDMEEHFLSIQEWNHDWDADIEHARMVFGNYESRGKFQISKSLDGQSFSNVKAQSGLINGRGRFWNDDVTNNEAPLETFVVKPGNRYRFRVIHTGTLYPWSLSIDNHKLTIIATDGFDTEPQIADSFIINAGERFDFILNANETINNYWIRGKTLESNRNTTALAILRYEGATDIEPTSVPRECTADDECLVVNCFFPYYPDGYFTKCLQIDQLKHKSDSDPAPPATAGKFKEYFWNFAFPGITSTPSSVNGRKFKFPTATVLGGPENMIFSCDQEDCGEQKICECTHSLSLDSGDTVQMVFLNMGQGTGWAHPIHMHGHTFYVLKMGYGRHDNITGKRTGHNTDIDCRGGVTEHSQSFCNNARWSNPSWQGDNIPGLELQKPVRKDTIIVPSGGYVIIRIIADNPGVWFMHCHIELHANDGMAMLINESFPNQPATPTGFPLCHSYDALESSTPGNKNNEEQTLEDDFYTRKNFWIVVGVLIGVICLQLLVIIFTCRNTSDNGDSSYNIGGKSNPNFS